jgi:hypothetical protein
MARASPRSVSRARPGRIHRVAPAPLRIACGGRAGRWRRRGRTRSETAARTRERPAGRRSRVRTERVRGRVEGERRSVLALRAQRPSARARHLPGAARREPLQARLRTQQPPATAPLRDRRRGFPVPPGSGSRQCDRGDGQDDSRTLRCRCSSPYARRRRAGSPGHRTRDALRRTASLQGRCHTRRRVWHAPRRRFARSADDRRTVLAAGAARRCGWYSCTRVRPGAPAERAPCHRRLRRPCGRSALGGPRRRGRPGTLSSTSRPPARRLGIELRELRTGGADGEHGRTGLAREVAVRLAVPDRYGVGSGCDLGSPPRRSRPRGRRQHGAGLRPSRGMCGGQGQAVARGLQRPVVAQPRSH